MTLSVIENTKSVPVGNEISICNSIITYQLLWVSVAERRFAHFNERTRGKTAFDTLQTIVVAYGIWK